jgi:CheY-like chemotaxis protein
MLKEIIKRKFALLSDEAINGKECLEMLKEKAFNECCSFYKVVFMDFEMPIMNGIEV